MEHASKPLSSHIQESEGKRGMMSARRLTIGLVLSLCVLVGAFAFTVVPAIAFQTRTLKESFGPDGTSSTEFSFPWSLGVDESSGNGDIYVASLDGQVAKFDSALVPQSFPGPAFGLSPISEDGDQIAVNSVSHDLYVVGGAPQVRAFQADGAVADFTAGPDAGTNELGSEVCGVAVDSSGDIYVSEAASGVHVFAPSGEPLASISSFGGCNVAVDSHGTVYLAFPLGQVEKFTPSNEPPVTLSTEWLSAGVVDANPSYTVAVDPADDHLFVAERSQVAEYDESGVRLGSFGVGLGNPFGLAVNGAANRVYVSNSEGSPRQVEIFGPAILLPDVETGEATEIMPKGTVTFNGKVKPDGVALTECQFEYVEAAHYEASAPDPYAAGASAACTPAAGAIPTSGETEVHAAVAGLEAGVTYHFRLRAANTEGSNFGTDESFATLPRPVITGATIANLTATSVDLDAQVNPGGVEITDCHFDYGTSTAYEHTGLPCEQTVGAGTGEVSVSRHLEGLEPNKTYHWRIVATSEAGTTIGVDHTFIYDTSGETLPDNRAYEMVTPPHKNAAWIGQGLPPLVAADGSHVVLSSVQCFGGSESCTAYRYSDESFLFSRTSAGWTTTPLAPPASQFSANSAVLSWPETGAALFSIPTPPGEEDDFYLRRPTDGSFVDLGEETSPAAGPNPVSWYEGQVRATSDFSHVIVEEPAAWPSFDETSAGHYSTYEFTEGDLEPRLVGVSGGPGSTALISKCGTVLSSTFYPVPGSLSADGETVYFNASGCSEGSTGPVPTSELFARIGERETVPISEPSAFADVAPYPGCSQEACVKAVNTKEQWSATEFEGASNDGKQAFFTSSQRLTDDAGPEANLYEYDFENSAAEGRILDVSAGDISGQGGRVLGVVQISPDGSHVYFVAQGVLTANPNAEGVSAKDNAANLYVFTHEAGRPGGRTAFIAQLSAQDQYLWQPHNWEYRANVTPDGRFLVFESSDRLTADETRTDGARQVFRYDAQTGQLLRVSIGEYGFNDNGNGGLPDNGTNSEGPSDAEIVWPGTGEAVSAEGRRSDPTMSDDGSYIFFQSALGLTAHALNDVQISAPGQPVRYAENIYEWHEGAVHLISDGRDTATSGDSEDSAVKLIGTDATGANVFFYTADQLVPADTDTQVDVYDARICTAAEPCITAAPAPLPPCLGEACHGIPPARSSFAAGATATFNGVGNVSPVSGPVVQAKPKSVKCKRGFVRSKKRKGKPSKCVKKPKKKTKQAKKSNRRAK
jgi:hypothetical protein